MDKKVTLTAVALRLSLGWLMFYAGIEKVLSREWTAQGFLLNAKTVPALYAWFALPVNAWWVDPLNAWGITLVGVALLLGVSIRLASWAGAALMVLYYFPSVAFPFIPHGFIVEEHIVYALLFVLIAVLPQAQKFGLANTLRRTFLGNVPFVRSLL